MKRLALACFVASALLATSCSKLPTPEKARAQLAGLNINYSVDTFVARAGSNDPVAVKLFLGAGMDPNAKDSNNNSALNAAAKQGDLVTVRLLLDNGAKIDRKADTWYDNGNSQYSIGPDVAAACAGHTAVAELLLDRLIAETPSQEVDLVSHAFWGACLRGHEETAKTLLTRLARKLDKNAMDAVTQTGLRYAVLDGDNAELVTYLLDMGAKIDQKDLEGDTPIVTAARYGYVNVVKTLLRRGANIDILSKEGESPYFLAKSNGHSEVSHILNVVMARQGNPFSRMDLEEEAKKAGNTATAPKPWETDWAKSLQPTSTK